MNQTTKSLLSKRNLVIALAVMLVLIILYVLTRKSYSLTISITGGSAGTYSYSLVNHSGGKVKTGETSNTTFKTSVSPGEYELSVTQGHKTYFTVIDTNQLPANATLSAPLSSQHRRAFIGDNPDSCVDLLGTLMHSHSCGDYYGIPKTHYPATPSQPSYVDSQVDPLGHLEGTIQTKEGNIALYSQIPVEFEAEQSDDPASGITHTLYTYQMNGTAVVPLDKVSLTDISYSPSYAIKPYKAGFLMYSPDYKNIWYFASFHSQPNRISIPSANTRDLITLSPSTSPSGKVAVAYINDVAGDGGSTVSNTTEIVLYDSGKISHTVIDKQYSVVSLCGDNTICLLDPITKTVEVKDISSDQLPTLYTINNIEHFIANYSGLYVVRAKDIIRFDTTTRTGAVDYSFEGFNYCGINDLVTSYVLCVANPHGDKSALLVSQTLPDIDAIDRKITQLGQYPKLTNVTIYQNIIFIVPTGLFAIDPATGKTAPNKAVQLRTEADINEAIDKIGFDRKKYQIIIAGAI